MCEPDRCTGHPYRRRATNTRCHCSRHPDIQGSKIRRRPTSEQSTCLLDWHIYYGRYYVGAIHGSGRQWCVWHRQIRTRLHQFPDNREINREESRFWWRNRPSGPVKPCCHAGCRAANLDSSVNTNREFFRHNREGSGTDQGIIRERIATLFGSEIGAQHPLCTTRAIDPHVDFASVSERPKAGPSPCGFGAEKRTLRPRFRLRRSVTVPVLARNATRSLHPDRESPTLNESLGHLRRGGRK